MINSCAVVYDSCVLYPNTLRDLLMELATRNLYRAKWTSKIHEEWIGNLKQKRSDIPIEKLYRVRDLMNESVGDCLVSDYEGLEEQLKLPDVNDRHVLAAAIKAKAEIIVTTNLKDFPQTELEKYGVEAQHQDKFVINLIDLYPVKVGEALRKCQRRRKNPPCSFEEYLMKLEKQGLVETVSRIKKMSGI